MYKFRLASVALGLGLIVLSSACAGSGANRLLNRDGGQSNTQEPEEEPFVAESLRCGADVCGNPVTEYNNGAALVLSPTSMEASFEPAPGIGNRRQTGDSVADAIDFFDLIGSSGDNNILMFGGVEYSLDMDDFGVVEARHAVYCTEDATGDCSGDLGGANYALGYHVNTRYPAEVLSEDKDIFMGGFTVIKTTLSNDALTFGVGVSLEYLSRDSSDSDVRIYNPVEYGSFVFGTRFPTASLPNEGRAAYAGFSQAYAQTDNRAVNPFVPVLDAVSSEGGVIANGFSAMVFSFDGNGAHFEHGFIDLSGGAFTDNGMDDPSMPALVTQSPFYRNNMALSGNFASPDFYDSMFVTAAVSVDASSYGRDLDYVANAELYYELDPTDRSSSQHASGLFFRLTGNDQTTDDTLDFTMDLLSVTSDNAILGCIPNYGGAISCFPSIRADGRPGGYGVVGLYGGEANLEANSGNARTAPIFAGGVWQYEGIVYLHNQFNTNPADDKLLGVVDLYGSFGGLIVDQPAQ